MVAPIEIDLSGLSSQFGLSSQVIEQLTEICVKAVTATIYKKWESLAKKELHSTLPAYLQNLNVVDKGRFARQIVLTGELPQMIENGASAYDLKEGFEKSKYVKYTVPVYNAKGKMIRPGGDWYLTIPFRMGTPGIVGQAGFAGEMPQEIYDLMIHRDSNVALTASEIPDPYNIPRSREAIYENDQLRYGAYQHKSSIYEGLVKKTAAYGKTTQNIYMNFRRAGANSDPMSWIHKGFEAKYLADKAVDDVDVETLVENEVAQFLDDSL